MPIIKINKKNVVMPNYDHSEKYWPILTDLVYNKVGNEEIKIPEDVELLLKDCFVELCSVLEQKIFEQKKTSFYVFCQNLHKDSIELWKKQVGGEISLGEIEEDFASSRRILKIILDQSPKLNLLGTPNFYLEIQTNIDYFTEYLEELLYIGRWCHILSEFVSRSQLFPGSIGIKVVNDELNILTYQPYPHLFKFMFYEMQKHNANVVFSDSIYGFKELLKEKFNVDYDILTSFVNRQLENPKYKFGLLKMNEIIDEIHKQFNYDVDFIKTFYKGLTVDKDNSLNIEDCFLKNQHENRHLYRPILELTVDGELYHMAGYHKWAESLTLLTTNSFPFGLYPTEWKVYSDIKEFVNEIDNTHDKLLENPIAEILSNRNIIFDVNIDSFEQPKGNNININQDIGDIDILFLDEKYEVIYVSECKHNRSRFDLNNWKRDYSNFKNKYENQLDRKVNWVRQNIGIVENHLKIKYPNKNIPTLKDFEVLGIFIINAPTVYILNGQYRAFTLSDIQDLVEEKYTDIKFEFTNEDTGKQFIIEHPYFDNLEKKLNQ